MLYARERECVYKPSDDFIIREDIVMTFDLKKLFHPLAFAAVGLFHFIFMFFNYAAAFANSLGFKETKGFSAYKCMVIGEDSIARGMNELSENGFRSFLLFMVTLLLILTILVAVALLVIGALGLLKELAGVDILGGEAWELANKLSKLIFKTYFLLNAAAALLLIVSCFFNVKESVYGVTLEAGLRPGIGMYFLLIFGALVFFGLPLLEKKLSTTLTIERVTYRCSACGAKAKAADKFCSACGGAVVQQESVQYRCSACGAKAKAGDKFCSVCGAAIVKAAAGTTDGSAAKTENEDDAI